MEKVKICKKYLRSKNGKISRRTIREAENKEEITKDKKSKKNSDRLYIKRASNRWKLSRAVC
jgi:hypothetical protein